jgi:hypothetical protein
MQDLQDTETHLKVIGKGRGLRLVALVILQIHPLKGNILSSHQVFPVQHQFSGTRRTLYHILHTNSPPVGPTFIYFFTPHRSPLHSSTTVDLTPATTSLSPLAAPPSPTPRRALHHPHAGGPPLPAARAPPPPRRRSCRHTEGHGRRRGSSRQPRRERVGGRRRGVGGFPSCRCGGPRRPHWRPRRTRPGQAPPPSLERPRRRAGRVGSDCAAAPPRRVLAPAMASATTPPPSFLPPPASQWPPRTHSPVLVGVAVVWRVRPCSSHGGCGRSVLPPPT